MRVQNKTTYLAFESHTRVEGEFQVLPTKCLKPEVAKRGERFFDDSVEGLVRFGYRWCMWWGEFWLVEECGNFLGVF